MAEYIEREALEKYIEKGLNNPDKAKAFGHDAIEILTELHHMPAADVEPVRHGKWEWSIGLPCCSVCNVLAVGDPYDGVYLTKYCPNCGAKMD